MDTTDSQVYAKPLEAGTVQADDEEDIELSDDGAGKDEEEGVNEEGEDAAMVSSSRDAQEDQLEETINDESEDGEDEEADSEPQEEGMEDEIEQPIDGDGDDRLNYLSDEDDENLDDNQQEKDTAAEKRESTRISKKSRKKRKRYQRQHKIFQDAISVVIPLNVTADLKIAIQRTRAKRIMSIYKRFPSLKKNEKKTQEEKKDDPMLEEDDEENKEKGSKAQTKKQKKLEHVPQPSQYGSVLDYLEAKYVKGVMLGDEDEGGGSMDDKSEGQGSVYSGASFLDDTDLQRDVAEQVMATTTLTKLELEEDDADFFVNVGNLEIEGNEYGEHYDPLQDKENATTKKRKKSQTGSSTSTPKSKKKKQTKEVPDSAKSKKSTTASTSTKKKTTPKKAENSEEKKRLLAEAKKAKVKSEKLYKKVVTMIKEMSKEELPRRRTKLKVALTCPSNKKPGDDITFTNPHNPGQRLRVKVPKDCFPGGTFKVTVPVKESPSDSEKDGTDHNKFSRDFQETLDYFSSAYDEWCTAQAAVDKDFSLYKEKQQKFDRLVKEFPSSLKTPVDQNYLRKVVRRARQNRHKRIKNAELKQNAEGTTTPKIKEERKSEEEEEEEEEETPGPREVDIPTQGTKYDSLKWNVEDFAM